MGNSDSQMSDMCDELDHLGDIAVADWKTKRLAFIAMTKIDVLLNNLHTGDYTVRLERSIRQKPRLCLNEQELSDLSDFSLFKTVPLSEPLVLLVAENTDCYFLQRFDKRHTVLKELKTAEQTNGSLKTLITNSIICLGAELTVEEEVLEQSSKKHNFSAMALQRLVKGAKFAFDVKGWRDLRRFMYIGPCRDCDLEPQLSWHAFLCYQGQGDDLEMAYWHHIMRRRAFLVAWALFPAIPCVEALYRIIKQLPGFNCGFDRQLFYEDIIEASRVHSNRATSWHPNKKIK